MSFFPPCYASLSLIDSHGTITLQRSFLYTLLDLYLLYTLLPSVVTNKSTGYLTLVLSAFTTVSVVSITTSAQQPLLGYSVAHAVISAALFLCSLLSHSYQQCRSVPLGSTSSPGSSLWSSGAWVCLAGFLTHSAIARIIDGSCGVEDKLPWLDLCVGFFLVSTSALVYTGNLFLGEAKKASAGISSSISSSSGIGKEVEESEAPLLTQSDRAGDEEEKGDPSSPLPSTPAPGHPPIPPPSLHDAASTFSVWSFSWLDALFVTGLQRQLDLWDLEGLPLEDATVQASARFQAALLQVEGKRGGRRRGLHSTSTRGNKKLYTLVWALLQCYGWPWAVVGAFQVGCVAAALVAPLALQGLLEYLSSPTSTSTSTSSNPPTPLQGLAWVCALACIQVASALCTTQLNYRVSRLQLVVRGGLVGALQRRVLGAPLGVRKGTPPGRLTNLLTVDVDRVLNLVPSFHQAWTLPLQVGAVIGELAGNVSWGCLGGVGVLGVLVPANLGIAGRLGVLTGVMMGARDARVAGVGEVLGGIRAVKAGGWEVALLGRIGEARGREFAALTARKYLDAACVWCWACTPLLMALATFSLVLALPGGMQGGGGGDFFSPAKIWASLAMLNLLVFPLNAFPWVISGMLEARVSLQRLSEFLVEDERVEDERVEEGEEEGVGEGMYTALGQNEKEEEEGVQQQKHLPSMHHSTLNVVLEDVLPPGVLVNARGSFMHAPSSEREEEGGGGAEKDKGEGKEDKGSNGEGVHTGPTPTTTPFCLQLGDVGVSVSRAEIVCVCGVMAAGKSSFLLALLGELSTVLPATPGGVTATTTMSPTCTLSYAPQSPWIRDGTLVDNVVFGESLHREQEGGEGEAAGGGGSSSSGIGVDDSSGCSWMGGVWVDTGRLARVLEVVGLTGEVRERGGYLAPMSHATLSGGQRARVGLARALYSRASLCLLDSVTAALDASVARAVWASTLGFLREEGRACVAVVGEGRMVWGSGGESGEGGGVDRVLVLGVGGGEKGAGSPYLQSHTTTAAGGAGGGIVFNGPPGSMTPEALAATGFILSPGLPSTISSSSSSSSISLKEALVAAAVAIVVPADGEEEALKVVVAVKSEEDDSNSGGDDGGNGGGGKEEEFREKGYVKSHVLVQYGGAMGWGMVWIILTSALLMQLTRNGSDAWLSVWSASTTLPPYNSTSTSSPSPPSSLITLLEDPFSALARYLSSPSSSSSPWGTRQYLTLYASIAAGNFVATGVRAGSFAAGGLAAAASLHTRLLVGVVGARMSFHDATPPGRLLNRLSGDVFSTDDSLPFSANILLAQALGLVGTGVILGVSTLGLFLLLLPLTYLSFSALQGAYRATSRELKRLDAVTRSPLLGHFGELQSGEGVILAASINRGVVGGSAAPRVVAAAAAVAAPVPVGGTAGSSAIERELVRGLGFLDASQRTTFTSGMAGQWLALRLQMLGLGLLGALATFCFLFRLFSTPGGAAHSDDTTCGLSSAGGDTCSSSSSSSGNGEGGGSASVAGLILSLSLPVVSQLQGLLGAFTDTEKEFISVERTLEYASLPPEDEAITGALVVALGREREKGGEERGRQPTTLSPWRPRSSALSFHNVSVSYHPSSTNTGGGAAAAGGGGALLPPPPHTALQGFTLDLPPGTRLGVCGRTGSGKSTLLSALWRLVPLSEGTITLGGEDLAGVSLAGLRATASIVTQEPLLLAGTLRFNLDPGGEYEDGELLQACRECGLMGVLMEGGEAPSQGGAGPGTAGAAGAAAGASASQPQLLDMGVEEGGKNFSLGQQQLVCLTRALLRASPLIALDEPASAADAATSAAVAKALRGEGFKGSTIILVAHRLESIMDFDRVVVLHGGKVVEEGPPSHLLAAGEALERAGEGAREDGPGAFFRLVNGVKGEM